MPLFSFSNLSALCVITLIFHLFIFLFLLHLVPTPPTYFTKVLNSSAVQVLWELPSKAGKAEGFKLSYRRVPHSVYHGPVQLSCHINAHIISNLGKYLYCSTCSLYKYTLLFIIRSFHHHRSENILDIL